MKEHPPSHLGLRVEGSGLLVDDGDRDTHALALSDDALEGGKSVGE